MELSRIMQPISLPLSANSDKFAWKSAVEIKKNGSDSQATRKFHWNGEDYTVTVHNPGNVLSDDDMKNNINDQIDKIVILTERFLKSKESFECNLNLKDLIRIKRNADGSHKKMPVIADPFSKNVLRRSIGQPIGTLSPKPTPPHIQNAIRLYDQLQKQASQKNNQTTKPELASDTAQIKVEKSHSNEEITLTDESKTDKNREYAPLGFWGSLYGKTLHPLSQFIFKIARTGYEKIKTLFTKMKATIGIKTVPATNKPTETPHPFKPDELL